jgi:DNA modification methylase
MMENFLPLAAGKLKSNGGLYCFCSPKNVELVIPLVRKTGLHYKNLLIWDKRDWSAGDLQGAYGGRYEMIIYAVKSNERKIKRRHGDILSFGGVGRRALKHPTEKPVRLLKALLWQSSNKGDLIVDPFLGSCSTGEAALRMGRRFWGCEVERKYYEVSLDRIKKWSLSRNGHQIKIPSPVSGGRDLSEES